MRLILSLLAMTASAVQANPQVMLETNHGPIRVELFTDKAPKTVDNFLQYVEGGHYDGTLFHRVILGFMVQGGGLTSDMQEKPTRAPIQNESDNGLSNERGTLAMARTNQPHSATAQFFINHVDNPRLDYEKSEAGEKWGYTVFGRVVEGMDVVDEIAGVETESRGPFSDVPVEDVIIEEARVID